MAGFYVDTFGLLGTVLILICTLLALVYSNTFLKRYELASTEWTFLLLSASIGLTIMFSTRHLLVIFVGLEMSSLAFYVLCGYLQNDRRSLEASLKYFVLGSVGSAFLVLGIALLFVNQGTLVVSQFSGGGPFQMVGFSASLLVILTGFIFKLSLFPLYMWVPDVYEGAPTPITAYMSVAVKVAVLSVLIRLFVSIGEMTAFNWSAVFWWLGGLTIVVGNLMALAQSNVKRMLAYSSIAHAGYLTLGLVAGNVAGYSAVQFYLAVYVFMNFIAFGVVAMLEEEGASLRYPDLQGLSTSHPIVALALAVSMISLAGLPPTGGFMGKFLLFNGVAQAGYPGLAVVAVLGSLISVAYYFRVIVHTYLKEPAEEVAPASLNGGLLETSITGLSAVCILYLGVAPYSVLVWVQNITAMLTG